MATLKKKRQQNRFTGDRDSAVNSQGAKVNTFQNRGRRKYGKEMEKTTGKVEHFSEEMNLQKRTDESSKIKNMYI